LFCKKKISQKNTKMNFQGPQKWEESDLQKKDFNENYCIITCIPEKIRVMESLSGLPGQKKRPWLIFYTQKEGKPEFFVLQKTCNCLILHEPSIKKVSVFVVYPNLEEEKIKSLGEKILSCSLVVGVEEKKTGEVFNFYFPEEGQEKKSCELIFKIRELVLGHKELVNPLNRDQLLPYFPQIELLNTGEEESIGSHFRNAYKDCFTCHSPRPYEHSHLQTCFGLFCRGLNDLFGHPSMLCSACASAFPVEGVTTPFNSQVCLGCFKQGPPEMCFSYFFFPDSYKDANLKAHSLLFERDPSQDEREPPLSSKKNNFFLRKKKKDSPLLDQENRSVARRKLE
jgi:hypothetical protein